MTRHEALSGLSTEACFSILLERAKHAYDAGNYAIAAGLVLRSQAGEVFLTAQNTLLGDQDPAGHAEMNVLKLAHRLLRADASARGEMVRDGLRDGSVRVSDGPPGRSLSVLYTTLEPCPMCTVGILNAGIDRVVIAAPDPLAGTLEADRLSSLPEIWSRLAERLDVVWAQSEEPGNAATYLPKPLHEQLIEIFLDSRDHIDDQLTADGVFGRASLDDLVECVVSERLGQ